MLTNFCKSKKVQKTLAILLIITMTLANLLFLGKNLISYAFEDNLELQNDDTQVSNVKFDAYFNDDGGNNVHSVIFDAVNSNPIINLHVNVKNAGYLKEAYIDFRDEENTTNTNYEITEDASSTTLVQNVNTTLKTMSLNYIDHGTDAVIQMPIKLQLTDLIDVNKLKQNSLITLRGIYVDNDGKETEISKTIKLNIGWTLDSELNLEQTITKYVPYTNGDKSGLILQVMLKVKQNRNDLALPVKSTEIRLEVPEVAQTLPEKVTVTTDDTMATNGNKIEFTSEDWTYNSEEKTIIINTQGYEENGLVWSGLGEDTYLITYMYPKEVYEETLQNDVVLHCNAEVKMKLYNAEGIIEKTASSVGDVMLNEKVGDIVTYNIVANEKELSKGRMYANCNSTTKTYDTEYETILKVNVSSSELVKELVLNLPTDDFMQEENAYKINNTYYKQLTINKAKMQKLLGEDGVVNVFDGTSTYIINKDTQDNNGQYVIGIDDEKSNISVQTSKPVEDGILEIIAKKIISKDLSYSKEQLSTFNSLRVNVVGTSTGIDNIKISQQTDYDTITLKETSTNAKFEISDTNLTSVTENKNVEFKITLNNNVETSDLYRNAKFTISLPKYIEEIDITGGNILYTSGLEIDHVEKVYTENGIVLTLITKGAETAFSDGVLTNGTNIVLNTNIKVNEQTPNISDKIMFSYTNENATVYENDAKQEVTVNFVTPEEMVTFNEIVTPRVVATSTDGKEEIAKLEILDSSKSATMKISILNKYSNICNNIRILGRIPFVGNKSIVTGEELGTTFNAELASEINTNGINAVVYYSENENATEDLTDATNAWKTDITDFKTIKSYLVVLQNYEMQPGEKLDFTYDCKIPENLEHNESAYGTYVVYFNSVAEYLESTSEEATKVGVTTGVGANIEMGTKTIYQEKEITSSDSVREYQTVTYQTTIKNTGSVDAEGVTLLSVISNGDIEEAEGATIQDNKITWNIGNVLAGESKTVEYSVKIMDIISVQKNEMVFDREGVYISRDETGKATKITYEEYIKHINVRNNVELSAKNMDTGIKDEFKNSIKNAELVVELSTDSSKVHLNTSEIIIDVKVKNNLENTINNLIIQEKLPEGLSFIDKGKKDIKYDENTRIVTINVDSIESGKEIVKKINIKDILPENVGESLIKHIVTVKADNIDEYMSNTVEYTVVAPVLKIDLKSSIANGSYIKEGSQIEIIAEVNNIGKYKAVSTNALIDLPDEFKVDYAYYYKNGQKIGELTRGAGNTYILLKDMEIEENIIIKIMATVEDINSKELSASVIAHVKSNLVKDINSNELKFILEGNSNVPINPDKPDNPNNPDEPQVETYKLSGTAWLDKNEDGKKDSDEELIEGIGVLLIDAKTGVIVTDRTNGTIKETKTSNKGEYTFSNLLPGSYMVVFEYDSAYYDITEYNKTGITEDLTSKAIQVKINKDGKLKTAGVTNTITISDFSIANINIGLVEKLKFDLSLTKELSTVSIVNDSGVKTYTFNNSKLGKIDIPAKYLNSTMATIEYKITIKNEGAVPGTAKTVVDYLPSDLNFDEAINEGWFRGADGNLYNNSLANVIMNPGEVKELKLILTKKMTTENTGTITNRAEIYEDYNELGYEDTNSTPGNKAQDENDLDYANLIITVKTGQVILYITITLISIGIIAIGAYVVNKKVLKGGNK